VPQGVSSPRLTPYPSEGNRTSMVLHAAGKMKRVVFLWLATEPTDLNGFLFCRKSGQPEAVGDECMAPAKIPHRGISGY